MTFSIDHKKLDQRALGRYIASSVIRRIEGTKSCIGEIRLPFTNKAERVIKAVSKHYPPDSNETEMPLFIDYFCQRAIAAAHELSLARKIDNVRLPIHDPAERAKSYAEDLYETVGDPIKLISYEVDPRGQFERAFKDIKHQYQKSLNTITSNKCHNLRSAENRVYVDDAFADLVQEVIALCDNIRQLIGLYEPPI